ncbi:hypothetical protein OEZ71_13255 [Defluviimonas sp. WL0050]|uniref:Uncharacterized protein n=1 Tax=Albidovulum litorale TaxID=2984134 RepID=A0ABT2ZQE3_9RHOB|nr:hypothetical protein [Defluviimonas sp. WL0050]MCV2873262.1 hypothetical protein [Defluviimonas sp. WL0050]
MTLQEYHCGQAGRHAASSLLRIAIPSWRFVGIHVEPEPEFETVSREEIQALFSGELKSRPRRRDLTDDEEYQKLLSTKLRRALYPHPVAS